MDANNLLKYIVLLQYVPRLFRIIPLYLEVTKSAGIMTETAWAGAAFNLLLYMLASHVSYCWLSLYIVLSLTMLIFTSQVKTRHFYISPSLSRKIKLLFIVPC